MSNKVYNVDDAKRVLYCLQCKDIGLYCKSVDILYKDIYRYACCENCSIIYDDLTVDTLDAIYYARNSQRYMNISSKYYLKKHLFIKIIIMLLLGGHTAAKRNITDYLGTTLDKTHLYYKTLRIHNRIVRNLITKYRSRHIK
jgi:hypothetical protein